MFTKRALLAGMAATGFGLAAARPASAQTYPTRPVKMVVPLPPGSAPDVRHRSEQFFRVDKWSVCRG